MRLCDRRHIGNRGGRCAQAKACKTGRKDSGEVVLAHEREDHEQNEQHRDHDLCRKNSEQRSGKPGNLPKLHPHQRHGDEEAEREIGNQCERFRSCWPRDVLEHKRDRIGHEDRDHHARYEERQFEPEFSDSNIEHEPEDHRDVNDEDSSHQIEVGDGRFVLFIAFNSNQKIAMLFGF